MIDYNNPDIRFIPDVNFMNDVQFMPDVKFMNDVQFMPDVQFGPTKGVYLKTPYSSAKEDESLKINSLADVVWPWSVEARDQLIENTPWLSWYNSSNLDYFGPIKEITDYLLAPVVIGYNNMIDPLVRAAEDPDITIAQAGLEIVLNTANELGEDADLLSNIVKSQVPSAGGEAFSLDSLAKSVGFDGPRKKYNYEIGDSFGDSVAEIALEVISDPMFWASIIIGGFSAAGKASLTAAVKSTVQEVGKDLTEEAIEQATRIVTNKITGELKEELYKAILNVVSDNVRKAIIDAAAKTVIPKAYSTFATVAKAFNTVEKIEDIFIKAGASLTPVGPFVMFKDKIVSSIIETIYNHITAKLPTVDLEKLFIKHRSPIYTDIVGGSFALNNRLLDSEEGLRRFVTNILHSDNINEMINIYEILHTKLQNKYDQNIDIYEEYFKYLLKRNKYFQKYVSELDEQGLQKLKDELKDSWKLLAAGPVGVFLKESALKDNYRLATIHSMQNYLNSNINNLADIYRYVDERLLTRGTSYKGKDQTIHYGLVKLQDFIKDANLDKNYTKEELDNVLTLLETLGITPNNAANIHRILSSKNIIDKNGAIKELIASSHNISFHKETDYTQLADKAVDKIEKRMGADINEIIKTDSLFNDNIAKHNIEHYSKYITERLKTVSQAIKNIEDNKDIERAMSYIRQVIRYQEWPELQEIYKAQDVFARNVNKKSLRVWKRKNLDTYIEQVEDFLNNTEAIFSNLNDTSQAFKIPDWFNNVNEIYKLLDLKIADISNIGGAASVQLVKQLDNLRKILKAFTTDEFMEDIVNYVENIENEIYVILSHFGAFRTMNQFTHLAQRTDRRSVFTHLADKESLLRSKYIPDLIKYFNENDYPQYAEYLNTVLSQVDTTTNLLQELSKDLELDYKLSKSTNDKLNNIWYDVIENNKTIPIADILNDDKLDIDLVRSKSFTADKKGYKETYRTKLMREISIHIDHTENITKSLMKDVPDVPIEKVKKDVKDQLHAKLNRYIEHQAEIGAALNINNITLTSLYDTSTIDLVSKLAHINTRFNLGRAPNSNEVSTKLTTQILNEYDTTMLELNAFSTAIGEGLGAITHLGELLKVPLKYNEAVKYLETLNLQHNLYSASLETNLYTLKYIAAKRYTRSNKNIFKLTPTKILGTNSEYSMLTHALTSYENVLHEAYKYETGYINGLKNTLIKTYSRPNALFRPVNPEKYFNELSPQALLGWEVFTKGSTSINNRNAFETLARHYMQQQGYFNRLTKSDQLAKLSEVYRNLPNIKDNTFVEMSKIARDMDVLNYANSYVDAGLVSKLHSLEDLGMYQSELEKYFNDDVEAANDIFKNIIQIENTTDIIKDLEGDFKTPQDLRDFANADYGYEEGLSKPQIRAFQEVESNKAVWIASMEPEELATFISHNNDGWLAFRNANIKIVRHLDGSVSLEPLENIFNFSNEELKNAGLKMMKQTDEDGIDWFFFRLTDHRVHNHPIHIPEFGTGNPNLHNKIAALIDKYRYRLNLVTPEDISSDFITVQTLNQDTAERFLETFKDFFGDMEIRKTYQNFTKSGLSKFYDKSFERINFSVIGGYDTYNVWNSLYSDNFIPHSIELSRNTLSGLLSALNRSNKINKWLTLFFNNDWSLKDSPILQQMFNNISDDRIKQFFANEDYRVLILRQDSKGLPKVYEYKVWNRHTLDKAAAAGGILVPRETYAAIKQVVNKREMTNSIFDLYRRIIPTTYKSMYLNTLGFPFRNAIDTLGYKNVNEYGTDIFKYYIPAYKALALHNKIQQEVIDASENKTFNKLKLIEVLKNHTKQEADIYYLTDIFMTSSASGGLSESLGKFLEDYNKQHVEDIRMYWEKIYEDKILFGNQPWNPLSWTRNLNDHIEQTGRFALFLKAYESGLPVNEAVSRVVRTHFNYDTQYDLLDLCEMFFWFSTFPINNFNYYAHGGLTRNTQLYKFLLDTQTVSWNNGEYTYEELKKTKFLSYHAISGNIRLGNYIIKVSPSVFDFINLVSDPIGNIRDRLNPFIATATGLIEKEKIAEELNPFQTQLRNIAKIYKEAKGEQGGSWIPSIYAKINDYDYTRAAGKWRNARVNYKKPTATRYPKIKSPHVYKQYVRHFYPTRYDPTVRKFTRSYLKHKNFRFYKLSKRSGTYFEPENLS